MVFNSTVFLFFLLPLSLGVYFAFFLPYAYTGSRWWLRSSNLTLLAISLFMYVWNEDVVVFVLIGTTLVDYVCAQIMGRASGPAKPDRGSSTRSPLQKGALTVAVLANVATLGYFKYLDFGLDTASALLQALGLDGFGWQRGARVALPLGVSFFTLQKLSYCIDVYRGSVRPSRSFIDYACYVSMFPQLVAGPIVRYRTIERELGDRRVSLQDFAEGGRRVIIGLGKKLLIADTLAYPADRIFALPGSELTSAVAWLGASAGVLQIYFDFSAYSDIAIGLGRILGFRFRENFNYPYAARSVTDFWRRWHISLSTWLRDYVYRPLAFKRGQSARGHTSLLAVFVLSGFWHGASWSFAAWGFAHGIFLVFERLGLDRWLLKQPRLLGQAYTLFVHAVTFAFFRSGSVPEAVTFISAMFGGTGGPAELHPAALYIDVAVMFALAAGAVFSQPIVPWMGRLVAAGKAPGGRLALPQSIGLSLFRLSSLALLLLLCAMALASNTHKPFIYFRF